MDPGGQKWVSDIDLYGLGPCRMSTLFSIPAHIYNLYISTWIYMCAFFVNDTSMNLCGCLCRSITIYLYSYFFFTKKIRVCPLQEHLPYLHS